MPCIFELVRSTGELLHTPELISTFKAAILMLKSKKLIRQQGAVGNTGRRRVCTLLSARQDVRWCANSTPTVVPVSRGHKKTSNPCEAPQRVMGLQRTHSCVSGISATCLFLMVLHWSVFRDNFKFPRWACGNLCLIDDEF